MSAGDLTCDEVMQGLGNLGINPACGLCVGIFYTGTSVGSCICAKDITVKLSSEMEAKLVERIALIERSLGFHAPKIVDASEISGLRNALREAVNDRTSMRAERDGAEKMVTKLKTQLSSIAEQAKHGQASASNSASYFDDVLAIAREKT